MRSLQTPRPRTHAIRPLTKRPRTLAAAAALAVLTVATPAAHAADRLSMPLMGFTAGGSFTDVATGPDKRLWIAQPEPPTTGSFDIGNLWSVSPDGSSKVHYPTGDIDSQGNMVDGAPATHVAAGSDGTLWASGDTDRLIQADTDGSTWDTRLDPKGIDAGGQIGEIAPRSDGSAWFTEPNLARIGLVDADGGLHSFGVGVPAGRLTTGADGNAWFTTTDNKVGRVTPTGVVSIFTPTVPYGDSLSAITAGPDGNVWVASAQAFIKLAVDGTVQGSYLLPGTNPNTTTTDLAPGPDGNVWFTQNNPSLIGRVYPDGTFTTDLTKTYGDATPVAITKGPNADLYYVGQIPSGTAIINNVLGRVVPTVGPHSAVHTVTGQNDTTATLTADESADGADATMHFEWGTTTNYGTLTANQTVAAGTTAPVSAAISGLRAGTVYHFRAVQTSSAGLSTSSDFTFKTTGQAQGPSFVGAPTVPPSVKHANSGDVGGALAVIVTKAKLASSGVVKVPLKCNASAGCAATVVVTATIGKKKAVVLAQKNIVVKSGATAKLGLRLSKAGAKAVRKAGKKGLSTLVTITVAGKKQRSRLTIVK